MHHFSFILLGCLCLSVPSFAQESLRPPNILFLLADDLGYGDLGCFGQKKIRTPRLDQLASEGMRLTNHYAGSNVCAPSRCVFMTGLHTGHTYIRDNQQAKGFAEGQEPVPAGYLKLPVLLKKQGYVIGGFGKWGLGPFGSTGDPLKQGFDRWFGYNCQAVAHNYYPTHLWNNDLQMQLDNPKMLAHQKFPVNGDPQDPSQYQRYQGKDYAPDLIVDQALAFITENKHRPFFLYFATPVPHLALQVPEDSLQEYRNQFNDEPYLGNRSYLPHRYPRAAYAAMITRMDRDMGRLLDRLKELKLDQNTIVVFTSDNGPLYNRLGGTDADYFASAAGMRGRKGSFYEGGFRVPCIVRWPGHIAPSSTSDRVTGFEDWLPTLLDLIGAQAEIPTDLDGMSFAPTLRRQKQEPRPFLYRESPGYGGQQSIRAGQWKAMRRNLNPSPGANNQQPGELELYDLNQDPQESRNVAKEHPEIVQRLQTMLDEQHTPSALFPMKLLDTAKK